MRSNDIDSHPQELPDVATPRQRCRVTYGRLCSPRTCAKRWLGGFLLLETKWTFRSTRLQNAASTLPWSLASRWSHASGRHKKTLIGPFNVSKKPTHVVCLN